MYAVGVLSSYISQGVYSVAGPFHPFGGVVDIIVVKQQDGSFKTSPWYVKFGKFQGVLKRREKVVEIEVNDVKAGFHMYLDHKGEAYFWQEVEGEGENTMASPPSAAASSGDEAEVKAITMGGEEGESEKSITAKSSDTQRAHLEKTESLPCPLHPPSKDEPVSSVGANIDLTETVATKGSDNGIVEKPDQRIYGLSRSKSQPDPPTAAAAAKIGEENGKKLTSQQRAEIVTNLWDSNWGTAPPPPPDGFCDQASASDRSIQASLSIASTASEDVLVMHVNDSGSAKDFELVQTAEASFAGMESSSNQDWFLQREDDTVVLFIQERSPAENLSGDGLICSTSDERLQQANAEGTSTQADPMLCPNDSNSEVILMSVDGHFVIAPMNLDGTPIESPSHFQITDACDDESKPKAEAAHENPDTVLCVTKELCSPSKEVSRIPLYASAEVSTDTSSEAGCNGTTSSSITTSTITVSKLSAQCIGPDQHGLMENITDIPSPFERYYSFKGRAADSDGDSDDEGLFQSSPALHALDDEASSSDANNGIDALPTSSATECTATMELLLSGEVSLRENHTQKPADSENARDLPRFKSEPISIPGSQDTRKDLKIAWSMPNKLDGTEEQITEKIYSQSLDSPAASRLAYGNLALAFGGSRHSQSNSDVAESSLDAIAHSLDHNDEDNTHESGQTDVMQQANFSQGTNFHAGVEISLCKHLLKEGMGTEAAAKEFESKKVTPEEFKRLGPAIVANDKLVVKFGGCYFPWSAAAHAFLGLLAFGIPVTSDIKGAIPVEANQIVKAGASGVGTTSGGWSLWPFIFRKSKPAQNNTPATSIPASAILAATEVAKSPLVQDLISTQSYYKRPRKSKVRMNVPTSEQLASLNLKEGANKVTFVFSTAVLGKQQVDARIYLWKWNTKIVISDVDGTITKSDVLGQVMPLVGKDWSQSGVTRLFSSIKDNGYELMFLSARAISQAYLTRQFLLNLKQDGETLPDGPVVISPDGLFPSLYREVIRRAPHEFKISCLEGIRELFPPDVNPFYAGFGNRDTDELSYLKVGIPRGKIFIINPKGEVVVNHRVDAKTYTSLHSIVHDIFPPVASFEQEDYNSWNYWKLPLPTIDMERNDKRNNTQIVKK